MNVTRRQHLSSDVPAWDPQRLVERRCPFCSDDGESFSLRPDGLTVRSCTTCGVFFVSPAPDEAQLRALYAAYSAQLTRRKQPPRRAVLHARPLDDLRIVEIASHVDLDGARVLDVGCGSGTLLKLFETLGARVVGTDLDAGAVRFARDEIGLSTAVLGTLEDLPSTPPFDVVCMFDFIEHPLDPLRQLEQAVARLAPHGLLALWTPNASSARDDETPIAFSVDLEHLQYLSTQTCHWLARRLDLQILHLESVGFPHLNGGRAQHGRNGDDGIAQTIRKLIRSLPGRHVLRALAHGIFRMSIADPRRGTYHLFCLLRKGG
jgi:2-polyprenyl-3-methyl-5-hydroxy-6-metoxy-1,4-benzoquinol methylase